MTRGYVLAGGRSSRMGMDKVGMRLGGRTLIEIAVGKLRRICGEVVVVGQVDPQAAGARVLADRRPGCGPLWGMEAALEDAGKAAAMFLPVDMPFIPVGLMERVAELWATSGAPVCLAVVDGRVQPLVSLVRPEVLERVRASLDRGEYRVGPMLEGAGEVLRSEIRTQMRERVWPGWLPSDAEWAARGVWFSNLNTPEEFAAGEACGALIEA